MEKLKTDKFLDKYLKLEKYDLRYQINQQKKNGKSDYPVEDYQYDHPGKAKEGSFYLTKEEENDLD